MNWTDEDWQTVALPPATLAYLVGEIEDAAASGAGRFSPAELASLVDATRQAVTEDRT